MSAPISETRTFHMIEAVADRLEGAPQHLRRCWSDELKARAVAEALEPGASVSEIGHRIGIRPSQLFTWRRKALDGQRASLRPSRFEAVATCAADVVIEVIIGTVIVRAGAKVDEAH